MDPLPHSTSSQHFSTGDLSQNTRSILFSHPLTNLTYQLRFTFPPQHEKNESHQQLNGQKHNDDQNEISKSSLKLSVHSFLTKKSYQCDSVRIGNLSSSQVFDLFNYFVGGKWKPQLHGQDLNMPAEVYGGGFFRPGTSGDSDATFNIVEEEQPEVHTEENGRTITSPQTVQPSSPSFLMFIHIKYSTVFQSIQHTVRLEKVTQESQESIRDIETSSISLLIQRLDKLEKEKSLMQLRLGRMERIRDDIMASYGRVMYNPRFDLLSDRHRHLAVGFDDFDFHRRAGTPFNGMPHHQLPVFSPLPPYPRMGSPELVRQHYSHLEGQHIGTVPGMPLSPPLLQRRSSVPSFTGGDLPTSTLRAPETPFASQRERFSNSPGMGRNMRSKTPPPPPRQLELYEHLSDHQATPAVGHLPAAQNPPAHDRSIDERPSLKPSHALQETERQANNRRIESPIRETNSFHSRSELPPSSRPTPRQRSVSPPAARIEPSSIYSKRTSISPDRSTVSRHESRHGGQRRLSPSSRRSCRDARSISPRHDTTRTRSPSLSRHIDNMRAIYPNSATVKTVDRIDSRSPSTDTNVSRKRVRSPSAQISNREPPQKRAHRDSDPQNDTSKVRASDFVNLSRDQRLLRSLIFEFGPLSVKQLLNYFRQYQSENELVASLLGSRQRPEDLDIEDSEEPIVRLSNLIKPFKHLFSLDGYYEPPGGKGSHANSRESTPESRSNQRGEYSGRRQSQSPPQKQLSRGQPSRGPAFVQDNSPSRDFRRERSVTKSQPTQSRVPRLSSSPRGKFEPRNAASSRVHRQERSSERAPQRASNSQRESRRASSTSNCFTGPPGRGRRECKASESPPPRARRR
mmetsp:Transcript_9776/g.36459  ORF Transcript_9776/g.36459 Transcript_9776/m.36459 type:complete len:855 (-) Transcript_9776:2115-4679(-)